MPAPAPTLQIRCATPADRARIEELRHDVYAVELAQHPCNAAGRLSDDLDRANVYIVAAFDGEVGGFVSVTPPAAGRYSVDKYVDRADWPELQGDDLYEVRILTVAASRRATPAAAMLMYAALRWIAEHGGHRIVAIGRTEVLGLYLKAGMRPLGHTVTSGAVSFELMTGAVHDLADVVQRDHAVLLRRLEARVDWSMDMPIRPDATPCMHGGASFDVIGARFDALDRRDQIVVADVLDAWFDPAPGVIDALAGDPGWVARSSPPTNGEGLIEEIATARGLPVDAVAIGAGSSDLIFRAFGRWLTARSRVLLLDPAYGEYAHVTRNVVGCRVDRLELRPEDGWRLDPDLLRHALSLEYDLVVLVNPNNPTGVHLDADLLWSVLGDAPPVTRVWVDEAYCEYAGTHQSIEEYAAASDNVFVCKSMSKVYALSGLRCAYLVGPSGTMREIRRWTPPWPVGLPAQMAAVRALRDPAYYADRWQATARLRRRLADSLRCLSESVEVSEPVANFVLLTIAEGSTAAELVAGCRRHGLLIRDLTPISEAFGGRTVRIAVRGEQENRRIVDSVERALSDRRALRAA